MNNCVFVKLRLLNPWIKSYKSQEQTEKSDLGGATQVAHAQALLALCLGITTGVDGDDIWGCRNRA